MKHFCLLLLSGALAAQQVDLGRIRADLTRLTSGMHGRAALEPGHEAAALYVESALRETGLRTSFQTFELFRAFSDPAASAVEWNGRPLEYRGTFKRDVTMEAPVVFAGYGITAPEYGYDDFAGLDVKGKIVLVFDREPAEPSKRSRFLGRGLTIHSASRLKRRNAQLRGALALLTIPSAHSQSAPADPNPARGGAVALHDTLIDIPQLALSSDAVASMAPDFRKWQDFIDRTQKPASRLLEGSMRIRLVNREVQHGKATNVIAVLDGVDPARKEEAVLLTSHFDHLPDRGDRTYPGANDNSSGTVAVIEMARLFAKSVPKPSRSIVFISFGAEENGLLGSYYYAANPLFPLAKTVAVLNLDMIARDEAHTPQTRGRLQLRTDTSDVLNLVGGAYSPDLVAAIRRANKATRLRLDGKFDRDSSQNTLWRCDHFPFLAEHVPAIWFFGGWHPGYHEPSDTMDRLNYQKLEAVIRLAMATAQALAESPTRPAFRER